MSTHKEINKNLLLGILALAQFMVVLDVSIVNVALPAIFKGLKFSQENLQWVITAYTLAFGGFLLFGGRCADLFGRRKTFMCGLIGFTVMSAVVGASQNEAMMIIARGLQGLAAAFMSPAALSIVLSTFTEGNERNRALGVWSAVAAGGAAAGLLFGGVLTEYLGWRWDFLVNVPVGIFLAIMATRYVPPHFSEADHRNFDLPGAVLVTGGLMALVYGLTKAPDWGWTSSSTLLWLGGALLAEILFVINESFAKRPLIPLSIFKIRNITAANLTQLPITASMFSMFFFVTLYLQTILGYSALKAGVAFLPVTIVIGVAATNASRFIGKVGFKPFMVVAPLLLGSGIFWLSRMRVDGTYLHDVLPGILLVALGMGLSFVSITIAATSGVEQRQSGLASGLLNTAQQIGGAIGLAVLSGVAATKTKDALAASHAHTKMAIAQSTIDGFHAALHVGTGIAVAASIVALILVKNRKDSAAAPTTPAKPTAEPKPQRPLKSNRVTL